MKRLRYLLTAVFAALLISPSTATAGVQDFTIPIFEADYYLSRDAAGASRLRVNEHIEVQFPDFDQNHGIERAIPQKYLGHDVRLSSLRVKTADGFDWNFSKRTEKDNLVLRIGDADKYVQGLQVYDINYEMTHVISSQPDYDGLFWDVNGDQWKQQFGQVTARVHMSKEIAAALKPTDTRCFTGPSGSTAQFCTVTSDSQTDETIITYTTTRPLESGETLTVESRYQPGTFAAYRMSLDEWLSKAAFIVFVLVLPVPLAAGFMLRKWWRYGRDPKGRGIIIPEYTPPKNLSVLGSNALLTEGFQPKAISATLLDLAIRGYLKIYETKVNRPLAPDTTSYDVELIKDPGDLRPEEKAVVSLVFGAGTTGARISLDSLKNKLHSGASAIGKDVTKAVVSGGLFQVEPSKAKLPYLIAGFVIVAICFFFFPNSLMFMIAGGIVMLFANFMPARTPAGVEQRDYLLGLKQFITVAEADRIKAMQSPHGDLTEKIDVTDKTKLVKVYERLLPFAMLFGIEKAWAQEFAGLYQTPPDWYAGTSGFNAGYFAGAMSGFNSAAGNSFTAPSSSGSGGSSGGGGGGGGGGGW